MLRPRILVVERDCDEAVALQAALAASGFDTGSAPTLDEAVVAARSFAPDAVLAPVEGTEDGATLSRGLAELGSDAAIVAVARPGRLDLAVAAMRAGADSFLVSPFDPAQAAVVLEKVLEKRRLRRDSVLLREQVRRRHAIVGSAPEVQLAQEVVRRAAPTKATVLVVGETGTGREVVAQAIHDLSPRRDRPFVRASCAALSEALLEIELFGHEPGAFAEALARSEGRFEQADGGTLFLDDVAHLPPAAQVRLLRVLQQGELERVGGREALRVDVRLVAASTRELAEEVRVGRFRDDLYYRLNVVSVTLPPLRERKGDIPALVDHFLALSAAAREKDIRAVSPGALSLLFAYEWPGNVRELEAVVDRAIAVCEGRTIGGEHLSPVLHGARPEQRAASALIPGATLFEIEREAILRTLEEVGGSTARAAEVLGVSVRKIQYRLKEYGSQTVARRRAPGARSAARLVQG
jgi:DNA-binding NtrC family response regulator